jgi:hypothetical protein
LISVIFNPKSTAQKKQATILHFLLPHISAIWQSQRKFLTFALAVVEKSLPIFLSKQTDFSTPCHTHDFLYFS